MIELLSSLWETFLFFPFLNILMFLYGFLGDNLGLAVVVLAVVIRILLIPVTKRQKDMTSKMSGLRPELEKLQKRYKNNPDKLAKEQMKLYKESGYNPIGCLGTMLPQILILAAIIGVIRVITDGSIDGLYGWVESFVFHGSDPVISESGLNFVGLNLHDSYMDLKDSFGYLSVQALPYLFLAVLVGAVQYVSTMFMQHVNGSMPPEKPASKSKGKDEEMSAEEMQAQMMKSMLKFLPLFTVYITITAPSVLGVYWLVQSIMSIVQYFVIDREKSVEAVKELLPFSRN